MNFLKSFISSLFLILGNERGSLDLTSFQAALKTLYSEKKIENLVYKDNPFLALVPKMERFFGENLKQPLIYGNPQARSATFSTAASQVSTQSSQLKAFLLTRNRDYSLAQLSNEVIKASESDMGAFLRAAQVEIDGAMHSITRSLAISLFRSGSGSIGQVDNAAFATTQLQLTNAEDVTNFEVGMVLVVSATDGGGTVRVGSVKVVGVDRIQGIITTDVNLSVGIPTIAQNDFIFQEGDYDLKLKGLQAWLPYGGPTATSFFGVDRTSDETRLAGIWQDGSAKPIEEALIDLASLIAREGGRPDTCIMNFLDYANLEKALGSKVIYDRVQSPNAEIGFDVMKIQGPKGTIRVIPDQNCPHGYAYMLQMSTWQLCSLGKAPTLFNTDGLEMLRNSVSDSLDIRIYYYAQLSCNAPGYNGVVKLRD